MRMKNQSMTALKHRWASIKEKHDTDTFKHIPVPVIYTQSIENAECVADELSDFLYERGILRKASGHQDSYLPHTVPYTPLADSVFTGILDLKDHIREAGRCNGAYRGIILIDVTEWMGHCGEKYFDMLLSYLSNQHTKGILPFFYVKHREFNPENKILEAVVSLYFKSARIVFDESDLSSLMMDLLEKKGIKLEENAVCCLEQFLRIISGSDLFHGVDSIRQICEDIAWQYQTEKQTATVAVRLLNNLFAESGYNGF